MIEIQSVNSIYSNEQILEVDKVGVSLKNTDSKGHDVTLNLTIREKDGQDVLTQDFEVFIGEGKANEFIIPLDVPISGNFPCEIRVSVVVKGKTVAESTWNDLIEAGESSEDDTIREDSEEKEREKKTNENTEVTQVSNDFEKDEDTETELMKMGEEDEEFQKEETAIEDISAKNIITDENEITDVTLKKEKKKKKSQKKKMEFEEGEEDNSEQIASSWGVLIEDGQNEFYEEHVEEEKREEPQEEETEEDIVKGTQVPTESEEINEIEEDIEEEDLEEEVEVEEGEEDADFTDESSSEFKTPTPVELPEEEGEDLQTVEDLVTEQLDLDENEKTLTEVESGDEDEEVIEKVKPSKKKSPLLLIIILVVGIGGGLFSYMKYGDQILNKNDTKKDNETVKADDSKKTDPGDMDLDDMLSTDKDDDLFSLDEEVFKLETVPLPPEKVAQLPDPI